MTSNKALGAVALLTAILAAAPVLAGGAGQSSQAQPATQGWKHFGDASQPSVPSASGWHHFGAPNASTGEPRTQATASPKATAPDLTALSAARPASISTLERQMYELINRDRLDPSNAAETGGHAQALRWNAKLAAAAREHSRDMMRQSFFAHVDREGRNPGMRVKAAGIEWQAVGENIAIYESVSAAQAAFMNEPRFGHNHRSNILDPKYTEVGVGIVEAPDGRYYITQEFIETPRDLRASFQP